MTTKETARLQSEASPLALLSEQRSHILIVQTNPVRGSEETFLNWYLGALHRAMSNAPKVLSASHYEQHDMDITCGRYPRPPHRYLAIYELSLDGAEAAEDLISLVTTLHEREPSSEAAAVWLYYPACEKVGRSPRARSMVTLAFANGTPDGDGAFREFYITRHIRHALNISALVSGQCFERTQFQLPGAMEAKYQIIAIYEQVGAPESIVESFASLPSGTLAFPMLDRARFAESVYSLLIQAS